ncbi:MAG: energy transducer TonB [Candidatus Cloacimonadaceae bacterium]
MAESIRDWKDFANSQFDKATTLSLLLMLFLVMVTPRVEVKKQTFTTQQMQAIELPAEEREKIKPPEEIAKPVVNIVINEEVSAGEASDPNVLEDIQRRLGLGIFETSNVGGGSSGGSERPFDFVPYEDPPEPINPIPPTYPPFAQKSGIQGTVILEVDVYKDGTIGNITVKKSLMSGPGGLDEAAINAVRKWRFQPGRSGGKPIDTTVIIPIEFTLTN